MAKTFTITGDDFLPQLKTNSVHIRELIQNKSGVMTCEVTVMPGQDSPQEGSEIVYMDDARFLFGGFISKISPQEIGEGSKFIYDIEASDYSYIFNNKIVRRGYQNQTLLQIVTDIMDTYVDAGYGFDLTNVDTGPTIDSITFDHVSVRKCFEKLQKLTGYSWWVDYEKKLFFTLKTALPAPEQITDTSNNFSEVSISYDTSQMRNSVIVIGSDQGEQSASTNTETFTGDGETRSWQLDDKPSEVVSIKLNGVAQQFSLDLNERDTDIFVYSFSSQSFRVTAAQTTPTISDTIEIIYYPRVPIIVQKQDPASIAIFAALDGGDGIFEATIKEPSITSKAEAVERADKELEEFGMPLVNGQFITRTSLLSGGSIFKTGRALTVNLPTHGISSDAVFLIQEVNIEMVEAGDDTEYIYTVRFGGKLVGVQEFLESLASEAAGAEVGNVEEILTIEHTTDSVEIEEVSVTEELFTPPFQYGAGGNPQGKWNLSEWS